jgi:hypothetical protein
MHKNIKNRGHTWLKNRSKNNTEYPTEEVKNLSKKTRR